MSKLIYANFYRIFKNKIFYVEIIFTAAFSLFIVLVNYSPKIQASDNGVYLDDVFFNLYLCLGFILAAGISLIVGTEYSDGTIRNKLIVGYTRKQIYFSNLISAAVPSCMVLMVHGIITYGVGYFLFGNFQLPLEQILIALLSAFLVTMVFSTLFVAVAMNCSNKAVTAVVSLLIVLGITYLSSFIDNMLSEPEMVYESIIYSGEGIECGNMVKNPAYVGGLQREIYEFMDDLLPTGQLLQMYSMKFTNYVYWPLYSIVLFTGITLVGMLLFQKRDIK